MRGKIRWLPLVLGAVAMLGFLAYGCQEGPFGRKQLVSLSPQQEERLGAQAFSQVLNESDVMEGGPLVDAVKQVGLRIARAAEQPEMREKMGLQDIDFKWEFRVVRSKQVNAFCLPGGKVVFYTGILPICGTEAGIATVMGHEIGHALARHGAERMSQQQLVQIGQLAAAASLGDMDVDSQRQVMALIGAGSQVGLILPYSRSHESEADRIGILLMARAGYDPSEAAEFWQRMAEQSGGRGGTPDFLSTHPGHETRIKDLRGWLPEAQQIYEKSDKVRSRPLALGR